MVVAPRLYKLLYW